MFAKRGRRVHYVAMKTTYRHNILLISILSAAALLLALILPMSAEATSYVSIPPVNNGYYGSNTNFQYQNTNTVYWQYNRYPNTSTYYTYQYYPQYQNQYSQNSYYQYPQYNSQYYSYPRYQYYTQTQTYPVNYQYYGNRGYYY